MAGLARIISVVCLLASPTMGLLALLGFAGAASTTDIYGQTSDEAVGMAMIFLAGFGSLALLLAAAGAVAWLAADMAEAGQQRGGQPRPRFDPSVRR